MGTRIGEVTEVDGDGDIVGVLQGQILAEEGKRRALGEIPLRGWSRHADFVGAAPPRAEAEMDGALDDTWAWQRHFGGYLLSLADIAVDIDRRHLTGGK